jgi:putative transposase
MDEMGRYMDNIFVEQLRRSLKHEEVYLNAYASVAKAKAGIGAWFGFHNKERQHQSLSDRTPRQAYEAECLWIWGPRRWPTGCVAALVDFGAACRKSASSGASGQNSTPFVQQPPRQDGMAHPIHDRRQVEEAPCHGDVGDVGAPDLIDPLDGNPAEPVGADLVGWRQLARVQPLIDRRKAGEPQRALDPLCGRRYGPRSRATSSSAATRKTAAPGIADRPAS